MLNMPATAEEIETPIRQKLYTVSTTRFLDPQERIVITSYSSSFVRSVLYELTDRIASMWTSPTPNRV